MEAKARRREQIRRDRQEQLSKRDTLKRRNRPAELKTIMRSTFRPHGSAYIGILSTSTRWLKTAAGP